MLFNLKLKFILFFLLISSKFLLSQEIATSIFNSLKFGKGFEFIGESRKKQKKEYFENFSDVRIFIPKTTVGFRIEYSKPPEYGLDFVGLKKKYVEFESYGLNFRAGDFYTLFARGLSLNLFENRNLAFDNGMEGIRVKYENDFLRAQLVGGDLNFFEPLSLYLLTNRIEKYKIRAGSIEISPVKNLTLGTNYVWSEGKLPGLISQFDTIEVNIPEFFIKSRLGSLDLFVSYAIKRTSLGGKDTAKGSGLYTSLSYSNEGFGVTFEFKDYRFDIVDPLRKSDPFRPTRTLPFQNPPIVHKEHLFSLTQRNPHVVDFNDEVGFQFDAFFNLSDGVNLNANFAMASRHFDFELNQTTFQYEKKKIGSDLVPSLNKLRSPFWEIYLELEYFFPNNSDSYLRFGINRRSETTNDQMNFYNPIQPLRLTTFPLEIQYVWSDKISSKLISESQWVFHFPQSEKYYNHLLAASTTLNSMITFGFRFEFTTNKFEEENRKNWLVVEGGMRISTNHTLIITYGKERGGTVCSNGICRQVLPFDGFRLSLSSNI